MEKTDVKQEYVTNPKTNKKIKVGSKLYKKLLKEGALNKNDKTPEKTDNIEIGEEPEFNERDLQIKMAELTTNMVADNIKQIVKSQKLSNKEYDTLLKKMLYQKLCLNDNDAIKQKKEPKKKVKKSKKSKYKIVEPETSSDSSDESD